MNKEAGKQIEKLVERFQCPGCARGKNTDCGEYYYSPKEMRCSSHACGTYLGLSNLVAQGLPKGFNKPGIRDDGLNKNKIDIRLWIEGTYPEWDHLNVPVWAMVEDGFLFVRTFAPRINFSWVDVIEKGTLSMCPNAIDVSEFKNDID